MAHNAYCKFRNLKEGFISAEAKFRGNKTLEEWRNHNLSLTDIGKSYISCEF